jgi:DNA-binding MarR family transcriptional regulator
MPVPSRPPESTGELLARSARHLRRIWADTAAPFDLSPHQVRALRVIGEAPLRPGALAERLHIAPRSATEVVDSLVEASLVDRAPDPNDRRAVTLAISDHGRHTLDAVLAERDIVVDEWLGHLQPTDRAELHRLLVLLNDSD